MYVTIIVANRLIVCTRQIRFFFLNSSMPRRDDKYIIYVYGGDGTTTTSRRVCAPDKTAAATGLMWGKTTDTIR